MYTSNILSYGMTYYLLFFSHFNNISILLRRTIIMEENTELKTTEESATEVTEESPKDKEVDLYA